jgi:hypothetical protein
MKEEAIDREERQFSETAQLALNGLIRAEEKDHLEEADTLEFSKWKADKARGEQSPDS